MITKYNIYINKYILFRCIKTLTPSLGRKTSVRSGLKSRLRGPVFLEKCRRVTSHMARLTKLSHHVCLQLGLNSITGIGFCKPWHPTRMYWVSGVIGLRHNPRLIFMVQRPKCGPIGSWRTTGKPKSRKTYGIGGLVRSLGTKRSFSASTVSEVSCGSLEELVNLNKKNKQLINNKLIHIIANPEVLTLAYEIIKSNSSNEPPGVDAQILYGVDPKWVKNTSELLLSGKYEFKASRRVYIPKKGKNKKRPLTISSTRDKMVQQAMYLVLNAIYETSFLETSHGSRPDRGNHTALKYIKLKFQGVKWCIKADIESNFPSISHKILLSLLRKRISCEKFLTLIKRSIKAGFVEDGVFKESNKGLFQGNVASPILNNVYLHELDVFMNVLCEDFSSGDSRRKLWQVQSKNPTDTNFKMLFYVRYVNDFVVGVAGSRKDAVSIKDKVKDFLEENLKLTLSDEKSLITNFSKTPTNFLGTLIQGNWKKEKLVKPIHKSGVFRKVSIKGQPVLKAPIRNLFLKATENGFFKKKAGKFVPTKVGWLINLDHSDILRYYNSVIRGILTFYSFANNRKSLGSLVHGLKFSCARTLALKYKLRFASKAFSRFGGKLKCPESGLELIIPNTFRATKQFAINEPIPDESLFKRWNNKFTKSNLLKHLCDMRLESSNRNVPHSNG